MEGVFCKWGLPPKGKIPWGYSKASGYQLMPSWPPKTHNS